MMLRMIFLIWLLTIFMVGKAQKRYSYSIEVTLQGIAVPNTITLQSYNGVDTLRLRNGVFSHNGFLDEPNDYSIVFHSSLDGVLKKKRIPIFIQPGITKIIIRDSLSNYKIESLANDAFVKIQEAFQKGYQQIEMLAAELKKREAVNDKIAAVNLQRQVKDKYVKLVDDVYGDFILNHLNSPVAVYALREYTGYFIDVPDPRRAAALFAKLPDEVKRWPSAKELKTRIDIANKTKVGDVAIPFAQKDTSGKMIDLRDFRGKYVLIDFWASWCIPCRKENPNLVRVFNRFKPHGFEILGVSFDKSGDRDKWTEAIKKDGIFWTHVSDLNRYENSAAKAYGVRALPQNFLIDPNGKILAKNIFGNALEWKLEEIFKTSK